MLPKKFRIKKKYEFNYIYRKGTSKANKFLLVVFAKNKHNKLKIGFSVSKKIGKANVRNLVKRRMREAVRVLIPHLCESYNYIVVARDGIQNQTLSEIGKTLEFIFTKNDLLNK